MDYTEWVERVLDAGVDVRSQVGPYSPVFASRIVEALGFEPPGDVPEWKTGPGEAVLNALEDLQALGAIGDYSAYNGVTVTDVTEEWRHAGLRSQSWPSVFGKTLTPRVAEVLHAVVDAGHRAGESFATVDWSSSGEVMQRLDWDSDSVALKAAYDESVRALLRHGFVRWNFDRVCPTYAGVVRALGNGQWELEKRLRQRQMEWERPETEFKRELDLGTEKGKEKVVRACVAMANSIVDRERLIIVGFDPKSHEFSASVDQQAFTSDRVESILAAYATPIPDVVVRTVRFHPGTVGVIEVRREPRKVPYEISKPIAGSRPGPLVRHGTHNEPPSAAELDLLTREGQAARGFSASGEATSDIVDTSVEADGEDPSDAAGLRSPLEDFYRSDLELDRLASLDDQPGVTAHTVRVFVAPPQLPEPKRLQGLDRTTRKRFAAHVEQERQGLMDAGRSHKGQLWRLPASTPARDEPGWGRRISEWESRLRAFEAEWNWGESELLSDLLDAGEAAVDPDILPRPEWRARVIGRIDAGIAWLEGHRISE